MSDIGSAKVSMIRLEVSFRSNTSTFHTKVTFRR